MKGLKDVASGEDLPAEKWLVTYRNSDSKKGGSLFMREFFALGYYEAYDIVFTHAEKMNLDVVWFREKRLCESFLNHNFPKLETTCTYCNKKFNHAEPAPCSDKNCNAEFCSRECMAEHKAIRHKV